MTRAATATKPARKTERAAPTAHIQRKPPEKLRAGGLHSIKDTALAFGQIKLIAPIPAATAAKQIKKAPWINATTPRDYAGAELAPYTGRPGAMDAFSKPSRVGKTLFHRNGRTEASQ